MFGCNKDRLGCQALYANRDAYYNVTDWTDIDESTGLARLHFPGVSEGAARLLRDRGVVGVCIDTMALDGPGTGVLLRELLQRDARAANANLKEELPARGARMTVAPFAGAGGAEARVPRFARIHDVPNPEVRMAPCSAVAGARVDGVEVARVRVALIGLGRYSRDDAGSR